jgi:hypothetical protein
MVLPRNVNMHNALKSAGRRYMFPGCFNFLVFKEDYNVFARIIFYL